MAVVNNFNELQSEIARLKDLNKTQGQALAKRFDSPTAIFSTAMSLFPKASDGLKGSGFFHQDFFGLLSRLLLPLTLNKTIFRKSNFIVKALVSLISQKASHYISEDSVTGIFGRIKSLFGKKDKKAQNLKGYGIPPM